MQTRQKQDMHEQQPPRAGDYYIVSTEDGWYFVNADTAARISRVLEARWPPRWVRFVDLTGARVWVRTRLVESLRESTERNRERDREFGYLRRKEERDDRRWDDDD